MVELSCRVAAALGVHAFEEFDELTALYPVEHVMLSGQWEPRAQRLLP